MCADNLFTAETQRNAELRREIRHHRNWHSSCHGPLTSSASVPNECTNFELMSALVPKVTRELTKMKRTLHNVFNLDKLRPGQAEVIRSVLEATTPSPSCRPGQGNRFATNCLRCTCP